MQEPKPAAQPLHATQPLPAVGIVCWRGDEVLLIRRGRAPRRDEWSVPGGKVELGESLHAAGLRELREETGVVARIDGLIDVYEIIEPEAGFHYVLIDYRATWLSGEPAPGDDADEARFMSLDTALARVSQQDLRDVLQKSQLPRNE